MPTANASTPVPGAGYYVIMGAGPPSLAVILATLPLLGRITAPGNVRFE